MSLFSLEFQLSGIKFNGKNIASIVLRFTIIISTKWSGKVNRDYIVYCLEVEKRSIRGIVKY